MINGGDWCVGKFECLRLDFGGWRNRYQSRNTLSIAAQLSTWWQYGVLSWCECFMLAVL